MNVNYKSYVKLIDNQFIYHRDASNNSWNKTVSHKSTGTVLKTIAKDRKTRIKIETNCPTPKSYQRKREASGKDIIRSRSRRRKRITTITHVTRSPPSGAFISIVSLWTPRPPFLFPFFFLFLPLSLISPYHLLSKTRTF